jgi:phosphatidylglycerophosphate synthase|nr:MAG: CDP-alcohol phosphatidyltransferase [Bacteroidota bacterium]
MSLGRFWTPSNVLSLFRLILALPLGIALWNEAEPVGVLTLMLAAIVTDAFDGHLARRRNEVTEWGKVLDPLADKICIGVVTLILTLQGRLPLWFAVLVLGRDGLILLGALGVKRWLGHLPASALPGKIAAALVALALITATAETEPWLGRLRLTDVLLPLSAFALLMALLDYTRRAWGARRSRN